MKQLKDLQAPIEVSTYDQVKAMLKSGVYHISCKYEQIFHSTEEIVVLEIEQRGSKSKQKQTLYTLNDLKDLESKIILIRDSGSSTVDGQSLKTQLSDNVQEASHNVSISSDISLLDKLSSKQVEGFLNVRSLILCNKFQCVCMHACI